MKAQQLRIGNYVYLCNNFCHLTSILSPNKTNGYMVEIWINGPVKTKLENIKPIPLDEEWMVKLGFEKYDQMGNNTFWATRDQRFHIKDIDIGIFNGDVKFKFGEIGWDDSIYLKYVHQFQNIIYALTGQELTLQK